MSNYRTRGPYDDLIIADGIQAPWYIITFDESGCCTSPQTRAQLITAAHDGGYDHIIVFSHGWNNVWSDVETLNRDLIGVLADTWDARSWASPPRVLVVSIFWPSVAVVSDDERGPLIASGDDPDQYALDAIAAALLADSAARLRALAAHDMLDMAASSEIAELLTTLFAGDDEVGTSAPTAADLLTIAQAIAQPESDSSGTITDPTGDVWADIDAGPASAGTLDMSWRLPIRIGSVYLMKQRAGRVGAVGVCPLLHDLLDAAPEAAIHLAGHSYGCRVMLSAICAEAHPRKVASLLLLQPAVSRYCFAEQVPTTGRPGGYRPALDRVRAPIMLTYSTHDDALHKVFGLAMYLAKDVGEPEIAGLYDNIYAALGGYGPAGVEFRQCTIQVPGMPYLLPERERILAIDGSPQIDGDPKPAISEHGDVTNRYIGWMLYSQLRGEREGRP